MICFNVFKIEKTKLHSLKKCTFALKNYLKMKKVLFIAVCILGILCFSSCRSTSRSCGLADATINLQVNLTEADVA